MATPKDKKVPVMVRLSQSTVDTLDKAAEQDGRSRADLVRVLVERSLGVRAPATQRTGAKRHADDCSCFACKPPKVATR